MFSSVQQQSGEKQGLRASFWTALVGVDHDQLSSFLLLRKVGYFTRYYADSANAYGFTLRYL